MSALTVTLGADISALKRAMAGATDLVASSARRMRRLTSAGLAGLGKGGALALQKGFALSGTALKAGIGGALAGGAAALAGGVKAVNAAADFEQTKVAFTTLIGDAAKAEETLTRLRKLGAETPFEFPELADAGRKLIAFGEGADTVPDTLQRVGDISAGIQAPVNEIAELYGKARVQGRLFAEDINQLTGRGIPIIGELAKQFGVSDSEVKKLVESGQVGFPAIEQAFVSLTSEGGKFAGMMAAQSKTTTGLFSTLKDAINETFLILGQPINDAIRPLIAEAIGLVQKLAPMAKRAGEAVKNAIQFVIAAFKSGQMLDLIATSLKLGFINAVNSLINGFRIAVGFLWNALTDGTMWANLGKLYIGIAIKFYNKILRGMETVINFLAAGMEWVAALLIKQLLKIPGMDKLLGFGPEDVNTNFGDLYRSRQDGKFFGLDLDGMEQFGDQLTGEGASGLGERLAAAAAKAIEDAGAKGEFIDTSGMQDKLVGIIRTIQDALPKPGDAKEATGKVAGAARTANAPGLGTQQARLAPIVTSLAKVGGGGYSSGALDAQRENNRLTGETNRLLQESNRHLKGIGKGGTLTAAFG
ncbi:tape measure protein [Haloferula sp. A504]|uniref:tape measure protein n=1 Tax=Haloferula sp. A504 TaxID=3373601 RepID=UPI0031C80B95|nr:tape measure protein [Verrucomicrobiaceae bacterium E54]